MLCFHKNLHAVVSYFTLLLIFATETNYLSKLYYVEQQQEHTHKGTLETEEIKDKTLRGGESSYGNAQILKITN